MPAPAGRPGSGRERITMGLRTGLSTGLHRMVCGTEPVVSVTVSVTVSVSVPPIVVSVPMVIELTTTPPATSVAYVGGRWAMG